MAVVEGSVNVGIGIGGVERFAGGSPESDVTTEEVDVEEL